MPKSGLVFVALVLITTTLASGLHSEPKPSVWVPALGVTGDLSRSESDLVVKIKKKKKKQDDTTQGERSCPAGYVVLDKANKYGSFCERKEGLPKTEAETEAEKCKFGTIGTPPNCHCPEGTVFNGPARGCEKPDCPGGSRWDDSKSTCSCPGTFTWDAQKKLCVTMDLPPNATVPEPVCEFYEIHEGECPQGSVEKGRKCIGNACTVKCCSE